MPPAPTPRLPRAAIPSAPSGLVDREVAALLTGAETRARDLLTRHIGALNQLTAALLEHETISGDQVRALVRATSPASNGPAGQPSAQPLPVTPLEKAPAQ